MCYGHAHQKDGSPMFLWAGYACCETFGSPTESRAWFAVQSRRMWVSIIWKLNKPFTMCTWYNQVVFLNENICVLTCGLDSLVYTASRIQVIICSRWVIRSIRSWNVDTLFNWIKKSDMFFFLQAPSTLLKVRQVCIRNYHTCKTCSQFKSILKKILLSTPNIHSFGIIHSLCVNRESRGLVVN